MDMKYIITFLGIVLLIFISCEKDDICVNGNAKTPYLIIRFYDFFDQENTKLVPNLLIKQTTSDGGVVFNTDNIVSTDSIAIPLKNIGINTEFILKSDYEFDDGGTPNDPSDDLEFGNEDLISISYESDQIYISRACGFKNIYKNLSISYPSDGDNWIFNTQVIQQTVENENNAHIHIFH